MQKHYDKVPTQGSTNPVKSDGLHQQLATIGSKLGDLESEVIYDVSANNDGATFASLSALLSDANLSTLIPITVRSGGMSIRFIQTSDNKYVQYSLMADEFTTDLTQWQGVGDKLVQDSLVIKITSKDVINGYYDPDGTTHPSSSNLSVRDPRKYSVAAGMILYLTYTTRYRVQYILWDKDGDCVSGFGWNAQLDSITIPEGVHYISMGFASVGGETLIPSTFNAVSISYLKLGTEVGNNKILTNSGFLQDTILANYVLESGTYSAGKPVANNTRIRTTKIRFSEVRSIIVPEGYLCAYTIWDVLGERLLQTDFPVNYTNVITPVLLDGAYEIGVVFKKLDNSVIDPVPLTIGEKIYIKGIVPIEDVAYYKKNLVSTDFYQGTIASGNYVYDRLDRIRTALYKISELKSIIALEGNDFYISCTIFDKDKKFVSQSLNFEKGFDNISVGDGYIAFVVKRANGSSISPSDISDGDITIFYKEQSTIQESNDIKNYLIKLYSITSISSSQDQVGKPFYDNTNKVLKVLTKGIGNQYITIPFIDGAIYTYNNEFYTWNGTDLVKSSGGIPEGGTDGQVLTPSGWSSDFVTLTSLQTLLLGYTKNVDLATELKAYLTKAEFNGALSDYETSAHVTQLLTDYLKKTDTVSNIASSAITVPMLSQAVLDLISASGSGTITNNPDDIDIETNSNNQLQLKGGGVTRFRVKSTPADNYTELVRCLATGLPIQIENVIDLANSDGSIRDITFNNDTLVFVGNGQIKNCHIIGNVEIQANKTKIFDNVYFHHWTINGTSQINGDSLYEMTLANTNYDVYNRATKSLIAADVSIPVNPFICSFTKNNIGSFTTPILEDGKYRYKEGNNVVLTFDDDGSGNIKLPIRKDYLFLNNGAVAESTYNIKTKTASYTYVPASDLTISRLYVPVKVLDGNIVGSVYPEWWGAKAYSNFDSNEAFQNAFILGGNIELSGNYSVSGGIRVYGNIKISGNKRSISLIANSSANAMFEIESLSGVQNGIYIYDLSLFGNKNNQYSIQDGIYCDFGNGLVPFSGYSMNNTYWYNLFIQEFTGSGVCVAVPGTSHIYSSYFANNGYDGITWDNEHFTLTNCTCWDNGRHGAYASGNHWRIIGGAYAHNDAGDNIHCDGAFESQIIGCSTIDSGKFVPEVGGGYEASSLNVYGYIWVGEGQGTHALVGGNGIHLKNCRSMTISCVRINNQNANGLLIDGGQKITVAECQFNQNNMTRGLFKDIESNISSLYIANTFYSGSFTVTNQNILNEPLTPKYFGDNNVSADWNNIKGYITDFHAGTYFVADFYNAANRPSDAGTYLEGTMQVINGISGTVGRTYIRLSDQLGNQYFRYVNINYSTGAYSEDTGWKKTYSAS